MSQPRSDGREPIPPRPQHTTLAGSVVIGASVGVIATVAVQLSGLHSLETRELVAGLLSQPPWSELGLDLPGVLLGWRISLMVVAGLATVTALLGYHALQRSHGARIGLAVVAVPMFLGGLVTGGILTSVVAGAALLLWIGPSRTYFAGGDDSPRSPGDRCDPIGSMSDSTGRPPEGNPPHGEQPSSEPYGQPPQQQPPPAYPPSHQAPYGQPQGQQPPEPYGQPQYGAPPQYGQQPPQYGQQQYGQQPYGPPWSDRDKRPGTVTAAAILTLVLSGLTLALSVLGMIGLAVARDDFVSQIQDEPALDGLDPDSFVSIAIVLMAVIAVWCVVAMVLAVFAMRRANGARIGLVVSAALAALLSLLLITSLVSIVTLLGSIVVIVCLFAGGAGDWYAAKGGGSGRGGMSPVA